MADNRPHSRKRHSSGKETSVNKRGDALDEVVEEVKKEVDERYDNFTQNSSKVNRDVNGDKPVERGIIGDMIGSTINSSLNNNNQANNNYQSSQNNPFANQQSSNPFGSGSSHFGNNQNQNSNPKPYGTNHNQGGNQNPFQGNVTGGSNYNNRRGGGSLLRTIIIALLIFFLISFLLRTCSGSSNPTVATTPTPTPTATPTPTPTPTPTAQSSLFNFGSSTVNNVGYVNASSNSLNTNVTNGARDKYTTIKGNGEDTITIFVYMCGTDLESNYGMATADIQEMIGATGSEKITIAYQTGGTKKWQNNIMTNGAIERYVLQNGQFGKVNYQNRAAMTDAATLADFIQWGAQNFPANRYMLIFWDHGGGSVTGYGYDEIYPNGSMTVDKISQALEAGGLKFDIIGFDACLMANTETAMAVEPYGDYLLASEETEPGTGWYYTDWLTKLAANTSMASVEIGKNVIDDFCTKTQSGGSSSDINTLSIIDLAEFKYSVPSLLSAVSQKMTSDMQSNNYQALADARSVAKEFSSSQKLDQIDLIHFLEVYNTSESKALSQALQSCVKYNRSRNISNAYGISIYFPYRNTRYLSSIIQIYKNMSFNDDYAEAVKGFANLQASGQLVTNSTSNSLFDLLGGSQVSNGSSYNSIDLTELLTGGGYGGYSLLDLLGGGQQVTSNDYYDLFSSFYGRNHLDSNDLVLTDKGDTKVLSLSSEQWELVQDVKLNVWVDDGTGYIDLGNDNIFEFDDDGDLLMVYDGLWVAINDQVVHYQLDYSEQMDDGTWLTRGHVPAILNGEEVHLIIEYSGEEELGQVVGAERVYEEYTIQGKLMPINEGDTIDFICDYYDYDGNFNNRYLMSEQITVGADGLEVSDINISNDTIKYGYVLQDIYNSQRRTPMLDY